MQSTVDPRQILARRHHRARTEDPDHASRTPRVLHLTTEYPPVIYGGLGTAVGGWVKASAHAGIPVGVLLVEGPLVLNPAAYGAGAPPAAAGRHGVTDRDGITFFEASW